MIREFPVSIDLPKGVAEALVDSPFAHEHPRQFTILKDGLYVLWSGADHRANPKGDTASLSQAEAQMLRQSLRQALSRTHGDKLLSGPSRRAAEERLARLDASIAANEKFQANLPAVDRSFAKQAAENLLLAVEKLSENLEVVSEYATEEHNEAISEMVGEIQLAIADLATQAEEMKDVL
jgi:hypothetical protein